MTDAPLATVEDFAEYVGVAPHTVHQWIYKGTAPRSYKIGNRRRFRWTDVEAWLEERADEPANGSDPGGGTGAAVALNGRGRTDQVGAT